MTKFNFQIWIDKSFIASPKLMNLKFSEATIEKLNPFIKVEPINEKLDPK